MNFNLTLQWAKSLYNFLCTTWKTKFIFSTLNARMFTTLSSLFQSHKVIQTQIHKESRQVFRLRQVSCSRRRGSHIERSWVILSVGQCFIINKTISKHCLSASILILAVNITPQAYHPQGHHLFRQWFFVWQFIRFMSMRLDHKVIKETQPSIWQHYLAWISHQTIAISG